MTRSRNIKSISFEQNNSDLSKLSELQLNVLDKLSKGSNLTEISKELEFSEFTVDAVITTIVSKLDAVSSHGAVAIYQNSLRTG